MINNEIFKNLMNDFFTSDIFIMEDLLTVDEFFYQSKKFKKIYSIFFIYIFSLNNFY